MANLREDLRVNGIPGCVTALTREERVGIAKWVRYPYMAGLADGQVVDPDDVGKPFGKFMAGWKVLCNYFGCR